MRERETFDAVLVNCDDQVLVRDILNRVLTSEQKVKVRDEFNKVARARTLRKKFQGF